MGMHKKPDSEVKPFSIWYREYRAAKKAGKVFNKPGRPIETDESKLSQNPRAKYMREYFRRKKAEKDKNN